MQRGRRGRVGAVLRRHRHAVDVLRQRDQSVLDRQRAAVATDGFLRSDSNGKPHLVAPRHHPHQPRRAGRAIGRNADFLRNTYGVDGTPYFRPPFGRHNAGTDSIAADHGYPTITLWSAAIGDSRPIDEAAMIADAQGCLRAQQIVLAHANLPPTRSSARSQGGRSSSRAQCRSRAQQSGRMIVATTTTAISRPARVHASDRHHARDGRHALRHPEDAAARTVEERGRLGLDDEQVFGTNVIPLNMSREELRDGYSA